MRDKGSFAQGLSIRSPWRICSVKFSLGKGEVLVRVERDDRRRHRCPLCGQISPGRGSKSRAVRGILTRINQCRTISDGSAKSKMRRARRSARKGIQIMKTTMARALVAMLAASSMARAEMPTKSVRVSLYSLTPILASSDAAVPSHTRLAPGFGGEIRWIPLPHGDIWFDAAYHWIPREDATEWYTPDQHTMLLTSLLWRSGALWRSGSGAYSAQFEGGLYRYWRWNLSSGHKLDGTLNGFFAGLGMRYAPTGASWSVNLSVRHYMYPPTLDLGGHPDVTVGIGW